jgi:YtkA-like protein
MKTAIVAGLLATLSSSVVVTSAMAGSLMTEVNGVRVELTSAPETPVTDRKTTYAVRLVDGAGKPVTDARVTLTGRMADGMSAATPLRPAGEPGVYRGEVLFTMGGPWELTIRVVRPTGRIEIPLREEVARQR